VCGPKPFHKELLQCVFDGEKFKLVSSLSCIECFQYISGFSSRKKPEPLQVTEGGFERVSGVTDIEQVSYVGSPYMPRCIRTQWGKEMTSNKHRSSESAKGANTIKDDLSEAITLRFCPLMIAFM
jgi:hypothetical protein